MKYENQNECKLNLIFFILFFLLRADFIDTFYMKLEVFPAFIHLSIDYFLLSWLLNFLMQIDIMAVSILVSDFMNLKFKGIDFLSHDSAVLFYFNFYA